MPVPPPDAVAAPPAPPPPGAKTITPEPPGAPPRAFPLLETEVTDATSGPPLAGWHGSFFLRDKNDYFRLYPRGRLQVDFLNSFGEGVQDVTAADGGNALKSRLVIRRARVEVAGEFMKNWSFHMSIEAGGQSLTNANGRTETAAGRAGETPSANSARWAAVQTTSATAVLADNWINYSICPCLNVMLGQYDAPLGMDNRTSDVANAWMEQNVAIRGLVAPSKKELGLTVWGELGDRNLNYEIGVFGGDGQNRPQVDNAVDFIGRIFTLPFHKKDDKSLLNKAQIGVSARHGERDQAYVGYSYPGFTTGQGFTLWDPRYRDSQGRTTHIIPSGAQNTIGGELRLPLSIFELRSEAYYVANNTREAIEGFQLATDPDGQVYTERLGHLTGVGWYAHVAVWPFGDAYVNGDPGFMRPTRIDLAKDLGKPKKGLEVLALVAGIDAEYAGSARQEGRPDANTPGSASTPGHIKVMQYGVGANYWYTRHIRASINYNIYHTPGSASAENLAGVPGNLAKATKESAHVLHELGTRLAIAF